MTDLISDVAEAAGVTPATVLSVLDVYSVPLTPNAPAPRSLQLTSLRFAGTKTLDGVASEPFSYERDLTTGLSVVASASNLAGKSTVLNVIRWALTGRSKLRDDVRAWIETVRLDGTVDGRAFHVEFTDDGAPVGALVEDGRQVGTFAQDASFEAVCGAYFLDRLDLDATPFWQANDADKDDGDARSMGWLSYFPALHVKAGSGPLLGDQTQGGQPGTLIQVYLGLPWALTAASARIAVRVARRDLAAIRRRDAADKAARQARRAPLEKRRDELIAEIAKLSAEKLPSAADVDQAMVDFQRLSNEVLTATRAVASMDEALLAAQEAADSSDRTVRALRESELLRPLLGRIEPTQCPRCDHGLGDDREVREQEHHCFVCDAPMLDGEVDPDATVAAEHDAAAAQDALRRTKLDQHAASTNRASLIEQRDAAAAQVAELTAVRPQAEALEQLRRELAVSEALIAQDQAMEVVDAKTASLEEAESVLAATEKQSRKRRDEAAGAFRERLGEEIVDLGRRFGVANLTAADPKLGAQVKLTIGGTPSNFGELSPGEMLRIRLATLIGLLRIGKEQRVGRFPGLLLVDSPGSEEMIKDDAAEIIAELDALGKEQAGLQVVIATARPDLVQHLPAEKMLGAEDLGKVF